MSGGDGAGLVRAAALAAFCVALVAGCGESEEGRATGGAGALYQYRLAAEKYREGISTRPSTSTSDPSR